MDLHLGLIDLRLAWLRRWILWIMTSDRPSGQHSPHLAFQALLRWSVGDLVGTKSCSGPTLLELSFWYYSASCPIPVWRGECFQQLGEINGVLLFGHFTKQHSSKGSLQPIPKKIAWDKAIIGHKPKAPIVETALDNINELYLCDFLVQQGSAGDWIVWLQPVLGSLIRILFLCPNE